MDELKPCPACESINVRVRHETDSCGWRNVFVACDKCSYRGRIIQAPYHGNLTQYEDKAVRAWNRRAQ